MKKVKPKMIDCVYNTHISQVVDGAIIKFPNSINNFMKVSNALSNEIGVVCISSKKYYSIEDLIDCDFGVYCDIV